MDKKNECRNKIKYTRQEKRIAIQHAQRLNKIRRFVYHVYKCPQCKYFHVGKYRIKKL